MRYLLFALAAVVVVAAGCGPATPAGKTDPKTKTKTLAKTKDPPPMIVDGGGPPARVVEVKLSDAHAKACLVKVGDKLPPATLPTLSGGQQALASLRGEKVSVIIFADNGRSQRVLATLASSQFTGNPDAKFVAVLVGVSQEDAKQMAEDHGVKFPVLLDSDKKLHKQVVADLLPCVYLLDGNGVIRWFSVENLNEQEEFNPSMKALLKGDAGEGA